MFAFRDVGDVGDVNKEGFYVVFTAGAFYLVQKTSDGDSAARGGEGFFFGPFLGIGEGELSGKVRTSMEEGEVLGWSHVEQTFVFITFGDSAANIDVWFMVIINVIHKD